MLVSGKDLRNTCLRGIDIYPTWLRGRDRLISFLHPKLFPPGCEIYATRMMGDIHLELDMGDKLQAAMYYDTYERNEVAFLRRSLKPGQFFVDIGAHVGYYSAVAMNKVGRKGKVLCFEPNPDLYARLEKMLNEATRLGYHVVGENMAVSDTRGTVNLFISNDGNSGWSTIIPDGMQEEKVGKAVKAETIRLDEYLDDRDYPSPHMIKIDVEGAEAQVLRGMKGILADAEKPVLLIEPREGNWDDVLAILQPLGYAPFRCVGGASHGQ